VDYFPGPPPLNPVSRILAGLLAVLALAGALFFGAFVLILAVGLGVLAWLVLTVRMWWLRRQWQEQHVSGTQRQAGPPGSADQRRTDAIDADYEVISRREDE
jgi:predicted lipid-binding transport protein (Tim44 family)